MMGFRRARNSNKVVSLLWMIVVVVVVDNYRIHNQMIAFSSPTGVCLKVQSVFSIYFSLSSSD